ncbi:MAG: biotin/lipoyl-containing protein [Candidatus Bipolaricaulota bacterium]|nr:biotin/lipoyl-containing protein [Candidatus Bipolaricaulota bacterium]
MVEIEELKRIIALLKEERLSEITVWEGERRITVRQGDISPSVSTPQPKTEEEVREEEGIFTVTAPLLGTFYSRPAPEEESFVHPGAAVKVGDTLCIIEAMKVMNEINAEAPGRVKEILVKDGEGVEYGQPLFRFEKA